MQAAETLRVAAQERNTTPARCSQSRVSESLPSSAHEDAALREMSEFPKPSAVAFFICNNRLLKLACVLQRPAKANKKIAILRIFRRQRCIDRRSCLEIPVRIELSRSRDLGKVLRRIKLLSGSGDWNLQEDSGTK